MSPRCNFGAAEVDSVCVMVNIVPPISKQIWNEPTNCGHLIPAPYQVRGDVLSRE